MLPTAMLNSTSFGGFFAWIEVAHKNSLLKQKQLEKQYQQYSIMAKTTYAMSY